jgi:fido (protein-threonine AMPylation protein)
VSLESADGAVPQYSPEEEQHLTANLLALVWLIDEGAFGERELGTALLADLHRGLFDGVRDHAGRHRGRGFGSERLVFGPHRSAHRDEVESSLARVFATARTSDASLRDNPEDAAYERGALHTAAWIHAEVIRVHPFEDGNGRTARLLMGVVLVRAGLRQIPVNTCKQDYLDCLNHYFQTGEIGYLLDLLLGVDAGYASP